MRIFVLFLLLIISATLAGAATTGSSPPVSPSTAPPGAAGSDDRSAGKTVILSDRLEVINTDEGNRFIFAGSVLIQGEDFAARCETMEVRTDSGGSDDFGAISVILASGNVVIEQGERIATAGRAAIYPQEDKVVLEDNPRVEDSRGSVSGYRMILQGEDRKITVESGPEGQRPTVELPSLESIQEANTND